jgi:pimeloyl-ACP methyl ester carboxylesterase
LVTSLVAVLALLGWREARDITDPCIGLPIGRRCIAVAPGVRLSVEAGGPEAVVLIPGFGDGVSVWDSLIPHLAPYRVIAIAPRWHGRRSSRPATGFSFDTLASDILAVLDSLGVRQAHLVGHSFGGTLVTAVAARYPERVRSVAYLDAAYDRTRQPPRGPQSPPLRADLEHYAALVLTTPADYARVRAPILALYAVPPDSAFRPVWRAWIAASQAQLLATRPLARVVTLDSTDHYLWRQRPDSVAALLTAFWQGR